VHPLTKFVLAVGVGVALYGKPTAVSAETIPQALAAAYSSNPQINVARAQTRSDDETVPIARSGYRPVISLFGTAIGQGTDSGTVADPLTGDGAVGLSVSQNIFTGFRVRNAIRESEAGVLASRELLRNTVQNVLFDAAVAYLDVIRDDAILNLRNRNVIFLEEQLTAANERFNVGENTKTDVSQTRARLASGRAAVSLAESNLARSRAQYHKVIGHDPVDLRAEFPYESLIPSDLPGAILIGQSDHPVVLASIHQADAQGFVIKQFEGSRLPTVSINGTVVHEESFDTNVDPNTFTILGRLTIPLYQGGLVAAQIRQAKEQYGLRRIAIDLARDEVRAAIVSAWALTRSAEDAIAAAQEGVKAASDALSGVEEEQRVGQRTTLDVLDAQLELLQTQEILIVAQRDRIVASFALLSAMGRLTGEELDLVADLYDPTEHYRAINNGRNGDLTPDGR
jgi:outer membrane protein